MVNWIVQKDIIIVGRCQYCIVKRNGNQCDRNKHTTPHWVRLRPINDWWGYFCWSHTHTHSLIKQCGVLAGESERISDASHAQERDAIFYFFSWLKFLFCWFSDFVLYRSKLVANTRWTRIFRMMRNKTITNRGSVNDTQRTERTQFPWTVFGWTQCGFVDYLPGGELLLLSLAHSVGPNAYGAPGVRWSICLLW